MVSPNSGRKPITDGPKKGNRLKDFAPHRGSSLRERSSALGGRRGMTVQFTVVGAIGRRIAFPAVHVQFAPPTVHKSDVL